jgi:hypothetical protein
MHIQCIYITIIQYKNKEYENKVKVMKMVSSCGKEISKADKKY